MGTEMVSQASCLAISRVIGQTANALCRNCNGARYAGSPCLVLGPEVLVTQVMTGPIKSGDFLGEGSPPSFSCNSQR